MKKRFIIFASGLLLLSSCGTRDDEAVKKDAVECVHKFIQALNAGDSITVLSLTSGKYETFQKFNPKWELENVSFSEEVGLVRKNDNNIISVVVTASYQQHDAKFIVRFEGDSGREGNPQIINMHNFLDLSLINSSYNLKRENYIDDIYFIENIDNAVEAGKCVEAYIKSFSEGDLSKSYNYYPKSENKNFKIPDSLTISNISFELSKDNVRCYVVNCTGLGKEILFIVYPSKNKNVRCEIVNSRGLFPIDEKRKELEAQFNVVIGNTVLESDVDGDDYVNNLRKQYEKKIAEDAEKARQEAENARIAAEQEAERARIEAEKEAERIKKENYKKERRSHWEKIGLVIKEVRMTSSIDKDGDNMKGIYFSVLNPTRKTIKYVTAYISGINAVGDRCTHEHMCRGIGPIRPLEGGFYDFKEVLLDRNNIIKDLSVSFKVIYTDGTSKNVRLKNALMSNGFDESWWD